MIETLNLQRAFFQSGATADITMRKTALRLLKETIVRHEAGLIDALRADLGKSAEEAYITEIGFVLGEIGFALKRLSLWALPRPAVPSLAQLPGRAAVYREPYGVALILSPWKYPFQLALAPLAAAVAAGNCAVLRPSSAAPKTAAMLSKIVAESFRPEHVTVAGGGADTASALTRLPFDKIFFTGSPAVGREVLRAAAENLVPATLELGGKCPAIVAADADIALAARRIVFAKCLNAGQTCVAPDYVLVARPAEAALLAALAAQIAAQFGAEPLDSPDLGAIIDERRFDRLVGLLGEGSAFCGGRYERAVRKIAPTVLTGVPDDSPVMREEIFGPILPVRAYATAEEAMAFVRAQPKPLSLYLFTADMASARRVMRDAAFGGGCVNDCAMHLTNPRLPFGGVGESGMGAYHGKAGFQCFSREKAVLYASRKVDPAIRYAPRAGRLSLFKRMMR